MTKMTRTAWGLDTIPGGEWREAAQCSPDTAHLFDVVASRAYVQRLTLDNQLAVVMCRQCPVQRQCLDDALGTVEEGYFIRGGHVVHRGEIVSAVA